MEENTIPLNSQSLKPGTLLWHDSYRIEKVLDQDDSSITYLATDLKLNCQVTVKEFFPRKLCIREGETGKVTVSDATKTELFNNFRDEFIKEAQNMATHTQAAKTKVHTAFEENGTAYYVTDYTESKSEAPAATKSETPVATQREEPADEMEIEEPLPPKKSNKGVLYGILGGLLLVIIAVVIFFVFFSDGRRRSYGSYRPDGDRDREETVDESKDSAMDSTMPELQIDTNKVLEPNVSDAVNPETLNADQFWGSPAIEQNGYDVHFFDGNFFTKTGERRPFKLAVLFKNGNYVKTYYKNMYDLSLPNMTMDMTTYGDILYFSGNDGRGRFTLELNWNDSHHFEGMSDFGDRSFPIDLTPTTSTFNF